MDKFGSDIHPELNNFLLTSTHVITLHGCFPLTATLLQAFVIDESTVRNDKGVLRLSHEDVLDQNFGTPLLRNPVVDPITGSTSLRLLERLTITHNQIHVVCSDLTLPKPSGDGVLPITISMCEKRGKSRNPHECSRRFFTYYLDLSDTGHLRGFCRKQCRQGHPNVFPIVKFVLDVTQDECTVAIGGTMLPEWDYIKDLACGTYKSSFGAGGRLCLIKSTDGSTNDSDTENSTDDSDTDDLAMTVVIVVDIE